MRRWDDTPSTLDCQVCGTVVRELTQEQNAQVAENPYNFIVYCSKAHREADMDPDYYF